MNIDHLYYFVKVHASIYRTKTINKGMKKLYDRKFGFELEVSTELDIMNDILKPVIPRKKFLKQTNSYIYDKWKLEFDFSTECELVSPILTINDMPEVKRILSELPKDKISITEKDSYHLHMYAGDISREHIIVAWLTIEPVLSKCFPKYRRHRWLEFATPLMTTRSKTKMVSTCYGEAAEKSKEHKSAISFEHFKDKHRHTIEFRMFEGTLSYEDVENWIKFCHLFLNYAKKLSFVDKITEKTNIVRTLEGMFTEMKISKYHKICKWLLKRHDEFNK